MAQRCTRIKNKVLVVQRNRSGKSGQGDRKCVPKGFWWNMILFCRIESYSVRCKQILAGAEGVNRWISGWSRHGSWSQELCQVKENWEPREGQVLPLISRHDCWKCIGVQYGIWVREGRKSGQTYGFILDTESIVVLAILWYRE